MIKNKKRLTVIPIIARTVERSINTVIRKSMHLPLPLLLQLLREEHMLTIGISFGFDQEYIWKSRIFRRILADIGGHVRALEKFYENLWDLWKNNACSSSSQFQVQVHFVVKKRCCRELVRPYQSVLVLVPIPRYNCVDSFVLVWCSCTCMMFRIRWSRWNLKFWCYSWR